MIETTAKIRKCVIGEKGAELAFSGIQISNGDLEPIAKLIQDRRTVLITMEPQQPELPLMDTTEEGEDVATIRRPKDKKRKRK